MKNKMNALEHKYKIELVTASDIRDFVNIAGKCRGKVLLCGGEDFMINAKSLLGVMLAKGMDWSDLWLLTEEDCYREFERFMAD